MNNNYVFNAQPLVNKPFASLPIGSIEAKGWLENQLLLQKDGITSIVEEVSEDSCSNSGWLGGNGDNWERSTYYTRGLVALAYTLKDQQLIERSKKWIDWSLDNQREDGDFGPATNKDWWPKMPMLMAIRDYHEATQDDRVIPFMLKYFKFQLETMNENKFDYWAKRRGADNADSIVWLYNRTKEAWLLDLAQSVKEQTHDWSKHFVEENYDTHVVNLSQGIKAPPVFYQFTHDELDKDGFANGFKTLMKNHGRIDELPQADEAIRDINHTHGTELCGVVERILSAGIAVSILGDAFIGDHIEKVAFNALPACLTSDNKNHQYFSLQNAATVSNGYHGFKNEHGDSTAYAAPGGFECCFNNMHMGWPKFVQNMWMATDDGGLVAIAYGPSEVKAKVANNVDICINQDTEYPFKEKIKLKLKLSENATFSLKFRIPTWCSNAQIKINDNETYSPQSGQFFDLSRQWEDKDMIEIDFPMNIRVSNWQNNSLGIERGPVIFSTKIEEAWSECRDNDIREIKLKMMEDYPIREAFAKSPWNYGLIVDRNNPEKSLKIELKDIKDRLFDANNVPVEIKAIGKRIPQWKIDGNVAGQLPLSPVYSTQEEEEITLIPYGCGKLRISLIPQIGDENLKLRTLDSAICNENTTFNNVTVVPAKSYDLKINYENASTHLYELKLKVNYKQDMQIKLEKTKQEQTILLKNLTLDYKKYNVIELLDLKKAPIGVNIYSIEVVENEVQTPKIVDAIANFDGSVTINTNMDEVVGTYKIIYGKESDKLTNSVYNFNEPDVAVEKSITIDGLKPEVQYFFKMIASVGGVDIETDIINVTPKVLVPKIKGHKVQDGIVVDYPIIKGVNKYKIAYGTKSGEYTNSFVNIPIYNHANGEVLRDKMIIQVDNILDTYYIKFFGMYNGAELVSSEEIEVK